MHSSRSVGQTWWVCESKDYMKFLESMPGDRFNKTFSAADESKHIWDTDRKNYFSAYEKRNCPEISLFTGTHD